MPGSKLEVRVSGNEWIGLDELIDAALPEGWEIHIQPAEFRDAMPIEMVATVLGMSKRHLRRLIKTEAFPRSDARQGHSHLWTRQKVRGWKRDNIDTLAPSRAGSALKWENTDDIDTQQEREATRKHDKTLKLVKEVREMNNLVVADPEQLAKDYPALKPWMAAFPAKKPR